MNKVIAFLLTFVMVLTLVSFVSTNVEASTFSDVREDYAFAAIERWVGYGVISGRGGGIFDPYGTATRAEFATMISNIMGTTDEAPVGTFTDVPNNEGMNGRILRATAAGVFQPGGAFRPNDFITRAEAVSALANALGLPHSRWDESPTDFVDDATFTPETRGAIRAASSAGVMRGFPYGQGQYRFGANETIIRKHLAVLFHNAFPVWPVAIPAPTPAPAPVPTPAPLVWRNAIEGVDYTAGVETIDVLTFIVIEMRDSGWTEYQFLINGQPVVFTRVLIGGVYQYRYVVDWISDGIDREPILTVQIR